MLTFDNFKQVFTSGKKPYWILYKGNTKGVQIGSFLGEDDAETTVDDSIRRLEEIILLYGDGIYTVDCRSAKTSSRGNDTHTFMYGEGPAKAVSGTQPAQVAHPAAGFFQGLDARYFLEQNFALQNQVQNAQLEAMRKEMEISRLKTELKTAGEATPGIGSFLEKNPKVISELIGAVMGGQPAAPQRIGVLSADRPIPPAQPAAPAMSEAVAGDDDQEEYEDYEPGKLDFNALFDSAIRIQKAVPNMHVNDLLDRLADFAETKPDQVQFLLTQLK